MADFRKLKVWRKAHGLSLNVERAARGIRGPGHSFLRSQMIRAASSIATNIVEGREQASQKDFVRFLRYSVASASELESHLVFARDAHAVDESDYVAILTQLTETRRMLHGLIARIQAGEP